MPVGPTGCNSGEPSQAGDSSLGRGWQIAAMAGSSWSHLHLHDGTEPVLEQQIAVATLAHFFPRGWSFAVSGGAVLEGRLKGDGPQLTIGPGWLLSARVAKQWLDEDGYVPFLVTSLTTSVARSRIKEVDGHRGYVLGTDFRLALTAGYTFFEIWRVTVSPRIFAGPIHIYDRKRDVGGRDRFFFQIGIGSSVLLPHGFTLFVDGSPGPEQAVAGGVAYSF